MISFLKKDNEEDGKFMGKGDIIFLLVIVGLVGGFWYFTKSIKETSRTHFAHCAQEWDEKKWEKAEQCYEAARDLQYLSDSLDSIIYQRTNLVQEMREREQNLLTQLDSLVAHGDTAAVNARLGELAQPVFLSEVAQAKLLDLRSRFSPKQ